MTTTALKKKIYKYIDHTDEKILQIVYTILEEHIKLKEGEEHLLSDIDLKELDSRWENYKKGQSKTFTLDEAKKEINKKLKSLKH
jgi:hypothetical protein